MLNSEASILAFSARVLALAEDLERRSVERLRFLAIVADGLDEFFMVRVAGIKRSALEQTEERSADGLTPRQQLEPISLHASVARRSTVSVLRGLAAEAEASRGPHRLRGVISTPASARSFARASRRAARVADAAGDDAEPGHPFPRVDTCRCHLAVVFLDRPGSTPHFAQVEFPDDTPRLFAVPGWTP